MGVVVCYDLSTVEVKRRREKNSVRGRESWQLRVERRQWCHYFFERDSYQDKTTKQWITNNGIIIFRQKYSSSTIVTHLSKNIKRCQSFLVVYSYRIKLIWDYSRSIAWHYPPVVHAWSTADVGSLVLSISSARRIFYRHHIIVITVS